MKKTLLPLVFLYAISLSAQDDYCTCEDPTSRFFALSQMMEVMQGKVAQQTETNYDNLSSSLDFQPEEVEKPYQSLVKEVFVEQREVKELPVFEEEEIEKEEITVEEEPKDFEEDSDEDYDAPRLKRKKKTWNLRLKTPKRSGKYKGRCPIF